MPTNYFKATIGDAATHDLTYEIVTFDDASPEATRAALQRDGAAVSSQLAFVAVSASVDARALAVRAVSAARARLAR